VEAFTADHNETIREVLVDWPSTKFEAFYAAYAKRKIADELSNKRNLEIAALAGNPNLDSEKDTQLRQKQADAIDEAFSNALAKLYGAEFEDAYEVDPDDPFFQAMERGLEKRRLPKTPKATDDA
jgi:hypothetical protein